MLIDDLVQYLEAFAPPALAEEWDNVGLLLGDRGRPASRVMTCLTITGASADEAVQRGVDLIVAHHPLPFRPMKRLTTDTHEGSLLWRLAAAGVSIYSPHTAFDSARLGINQRLAAGLGIASPQPLLPAADNDVGGGRWGQLAPPISLQELADRAKTFLKIPQVQIVGLATTEIAAAAVACGSAGEFVGGAAEAGCQALVTGEVRFHTCLEAEAAGVCLVLAGHFATERFAVEQLAGVLAAAFPRLEVWASAQERDPLAWA